MLFMNVISCKHRKCPSTNPECKRRMGTVTMHDHLLSNQKHLFWSLRVNCVCVCACVCVCVCVKTCVSFDMYACRYNEHWNVLKLTSIKNVLYTCIPNFSCSTNYDILSQPRSNHSTLHLRIQIVLQPQNMFIKTTINKNQKSYL